MSVRLSVVVPVYRVEPYLMECLDSIRAGLTLDELARVEIIAVDDASPDRCGAMLDDFQARHDFVRVEHLPHNVGLGLARNAGLAEATGDYVWFVDSDDRLPDGSVRAVLEALDAERPDVLLIDHLRVHEDGRRKVDASSHLLAGEPALERMLGVQHTAWNRIAGRKFLRRNGLRFGPGWYEDVSFSHPVLLAADRIAALNRVCYHYRVGRLGAITATRSVRHFEAFDQYDRLQEWVAAHAVSPEIRARLFTLMISHLLVVAGNDGRMHPAHRRRFFEKTAALHRRHRPQGYHPPSGMSGLKHRLVSSGAYGVYSLLRTGYRVAGKRRRKPERTPLVSREVPSAPHPAQSASII
ncbi:glycosyltransferase family 2 protein [Actinoplanes sp. NPDC051513]|uniref:glycosyltransferase family 2 protein n=1 Tax=Actinoplanes sp. NPDC051513 TaxID=3363908 RepID=UPI0037A8EC7B